MRAGLKKFVHPIPVGTKTNVGTIRSYKYVRYGFGKYRYFVEETKRDFGEEDITEIISTKKVKINLDNFR
jgi:hypothetical protein